MESSGPATTTPTITQQSVRSNSTAFVMPWTERSLSNCLAQWSLAASR